MQSRAATALQRPEGLMLRLSIAVLVASVVVGAQSRPAEDNAFPHTRSVRPCHCGVPG